MEIFEALLPGPHLRRCRLHRGLPVRGGRLRRGHQPGGHVAAARLPGAVPQIPAI